jgi:hypothetical protein
MISWSLLPLSMRYLPMRDSTGTSWKTDRRSAIVRDAEEAHGRVILCSSSLGCSALSVVAEKRGAHGQPETVCMVPPSDPFRWEVRRLVIVRRLKLAS